MFDARIPVAFGALSDARDGDVTMELGPDAAGGHAAGCACCLPRSRAAEALSRLFVQRARGEVAFFRRVLAVCGAGATAEIRAALRSDAVVSARFRLD